MKRYIIKDNFPKKLDIIVWEGEVYSLMQLNDISVSTAKNIIILSKKNLLTFESIKIKIY